MTEQQDNTSNTLIPGAEIDSDGPEGTPEGNDNGEPQKGNREARYRVERNEARAALAAAEERIQRMQRAEVERLASEKLSHPSDLFSLSGNDVADYLTEDGDVDAEKVAADVDAILAERPGMRKQTPSYDPSQGRGGKPPAKREPSWGALLKD